ncbi:MAG: phosphoadenylyl-sulfate reductase [Verrucomicrobiota bacterium]
MNHTSSLDSAATSQTWQDLDLRELNNTLTTRSAEERLQWAVNQFPEKIVMTSSFGAQAAVTLHLTTQIWPKIPVVLIDTGYLFPETYKFIDDLTERLKLNLKIYRPETSAAWQEARHGKLWEKGKKGIELYNQMNKVEPLQRALRDLRADVWIAGLRRAQSSSRENLSVIALQENRLKLHPIVEWTDKNIYDYLTKHDLPYHPLWHEGYVSIGDTHTTQKYSDGMSIEETRFFGLKRECGIHENAQIDFSI